MIATCSTTSLGDQVWHFQSERWQVASLLLETEGVALVGDPTFTPDEILAIHSATISTGARNTHLLLTHSHFDHTCGIGFFPEAEVVAGQDTAHVVESGRASAQLATAAGEWGMDWPPRLRVDRAVMPGAEFSCGPFRIIPIDTPGNTLDGTGYVLLDQGILLAGDFLGSMIYPFIEGPPSLARATCERLLGVLDQHDLAWVVPGHGPALVPADARAIGEADFVYLDRLESVAREAVKCGASPGSALLEVYAVEVPRPIPDDLEIYSLRVCNARRALEAAGMELLIREDESWSLLQA